MKARDSRLDWESDEHFFRLIHHYDGTAYRMIIDQRPEFKKSEE